jgi:predicted DNA-binding transcriptional regulator AlpA
MNTSPNPQLLNSRDAASRLAISLRTLWTKTNSGEICCIRIGSSVRYSLIDLEAYINKCRVQGNRGDKSNLDEADSELDLSNLDTEEGDE